MKKFNCIVLVIIFSILGSCQKEELEIINDNNNVASLSSSSPLTSLVERVTQSPTSSDNVLDNSSCFKVQLPVTVIVNGQNIVVTTQADYVTVQTAIDAFSNDDDIVNFVYPITIQYQNFQTQLVSNPDQLDDILDDCDEDDGFDEIDCIQIVFPISINVYNTGSQTPTTVTFTNNAQLFSFLDNLSSSTLIAINYPISIINSNGQTISITSNSQFENFIDDSIDDCDSSSGGSGGGSVDFVTTLTAGTWRITYFFDDQDETSNYSGYNFTFNSSGTSLAIKNTTIINGTWSTYMDSGNQKMILGFDGLTLDEIEDDWKVIEFTSSSIRLKHISGGDGSTDYLYFTKN